MLLQVSNETDGVLNFTVQPLFQLKFTVHQSSAYVLSLLHLPYPSETPQPSNAESAALGKLGTFGIFNPSCPPPSKCLMRKQSGAQLCTILNAWQVRSGRALKNCPTQGSMEVILIPPSPWRTWIVYPILFLSELHSPLSWCPQGEGTGWNECPFRIHQCQVPHHQE